jgi:hypothetical protein
MHPHPESYICRRAPSPIQVDGRLDDRAWRAAAWTHDFVDIEGGAKPPPPLRTRVKMLWDDAFFYIAAEMEEPHVWATLTEHDSVIFRDNDFEVFLDPNGDNHDYFEFEINALNTGWDLRLPKPYRDGGPALNEWDMPGLQTAVWVDGTLNDSTDLDRGWCVELALPWTAFAEHAGSPCPPRAGDVWRVNFSRVEWDAIPAGRGYAKVEGRPEHNWVWSPQHAVDMHRPELWGYVLFADESLGEALLPRDADWEAKMRLMEVYWAQRSFRESHGRWASQLLDLNLRESGPILEMTSDGWRASLLSEDRLWRVRHDSKLWLAPPP